MSISSIFVGMIFPGTIFAGIVLAGVVVVFPTSAGSANVCVFYPNFFVWGRAHSPVRRAQPDWFL
jgi:hypothetical protein